MTTFAYRVIGAVRLDSRIYEEVEADRQATLQAVVVVLTASAAGGIGLLIPRYAFYAAVLLVFVMIGAIVTHVAIVGGSPAPATSLLVLSGIIAWLRTPQATSKWNTI